MTDTVIDRAIPENPEADVIVAELIEVIDRNERRERALPSLSFHV
jgi:hypothetical protein